MKPSLFAVRMVDHEVGELVRRLHMIKPFALHETMVPAAQPAGDTLRRIDAYLHGGREALVASALRFRRWLQGSGVEQVRFAAVYRRYVFLRLQIIAALTPAALSCSIKACRPRKPMLPGTSVMMPGILTRISGWPVM